jgi:DNA-binding CsgD family transcriptional regulator/N-acetylneuraminic acid mutarotase
MADNNDLSERELEILKLVATGASNKEIAQKLFISTNTVKVHLRNIFAKIGANSRTEAAMYAVNTGLVPSSGRMGEEYPNRAELPATSLAVPRPRLSSWIVAVLALAILGVLGITGYLVWQGTRSASADIQSPTSPQWKENAPMPTARYGLAASVYENMIYAIAGESGLGVTNKVERYDPATNSWQALKDKPTAVSDVSAVVIGGKIYVPGGKLSSGEVTNLFEIYDPRLNDWTQGAPLPAAICGYAIAVYEGKLYLFGGWDGKNYLDTVLEYDPDQDLWKTKSHLSSPRAYAASAQVEGKIYVFGGFDGKKASKLSEIYNPNLDDGSADPWEVTTELPEGRYGMGIASVLDTIYIVGGSTTGEGNLPNYGFSTLSGQWQNINPLPIKKLSNLGLVNDGTDLYAIGGEADKSVFADNNSLKVLYITVLPIMH